MFEMRYPLLTTTLLAFAQFSPTAAQCGCNAALHPGVTPGRSVNQSLENSQSGVATRGYRIHLPPGYDNTEGVPLILSFHGRTQDALYQENLTKFSDPSYGFEGIAVYPEGVPLIRVCIQFLRVPSRY